SICRRLSRTRSSTRQIWGISHHCHPGRARRSRARAGTHVLHMPSSNTSPIRLCVMQGDGIGPEITAATLDVLRAAGTLWQIEFAFEDVKVGLEPLKAQGTTFPEASFEAAKAADGVILGPVSHNDYPPADKGGINPSGALRKRLDLFANIRPAKTRADFPARCGKPVDLVVVREN